MLLLNNCFWLDVIDFIDKDRVPRNCNFNTTDTFVLISHFISYFDKIHAYILIHSLFGSFTYPIPLFCVLLYLYPYWPLTYYLPLTYPSPTHYLPVTYLLLTSHLPLTYPIPLTYPLPTSYLPFTYPSLSHQVLTTVQQYIRYLILEKLEVPGVDVDGVIKSLRRLPWGDETEQVGVIYRVNFWGEKWLKKCCHFF